MKKIKLELEGLDGNAFSLLGAFRKQALKEGWTAWEAQEVHDEAVKGDYDHLVKTLSERCE